MQLNLKEKSVIVTGAASNIGRGIALAFAEEGAAVAIADIDEGRAQVVADEALARGASKAMAVKADVSNWTEVQAMVATVEQSFGSVDILVNNAGWVVDRLFVEKPRSRMGEGSPGQPLGHDQLHARGARRHDQPFQRRGGQHRFRCRPDRRVPRRRLRRLQGRRDRAVEDARPRKRPAQHPL